MKHGETAPRSIDLQGHQNNIDFVQFRWKTVQDAILGMR